MNEAIGPYMNEDGDWWVPTSVSFRRAKLLVRGCVDERDSRIVFKGTQRVDNHEHESSGWVDEICLPNECHRDVECWHFFEEER